MNFLTEKERDYAKACLIFAKQIGLIDDDSLDAVGSRCEKANQEKKDKLQKGETVFGLTEYSLPAYLEYELTRFKLAFASMKKEVKDNYNYREISFDEKVAYYNNNSDLFTRYNGDSFTFSEIEDVIEKRIREEEYDDEIKNILCQLTDR